MKEPSEYPVGSHIRAHRKRKRLSMRALAEASGLSTNAISKIERGETSPTVSTLRRLANALDIPIIAFFREDTDENTIFVKRSHWSSSQVMGAVIETLSGGLPDQHLEPLMVTMEPGAGNTTDTYTHSGEEFVLCLEGEIEYRVGDRLYQMETGDGLLFEPDQPHCFRNNTQSPAKLLIVIQEQDPESRHLARQVHAEV